MHTAKHVDSESGSGRSSSSSSAHPRAARAADSSTDEDVPRLGLDPGEPQAPSPAPAIPFGVQPGAVARVRARFPRLSAPARAAGPPRPAQPHARTERAWCSTRRRSSPWTSTTSLTPAWCRTPGCSSTSSTATRLVSATVVLAGTSAMDAAGYYNPVDQMGVNDAYLTVNLTQEARLPAADERRRLHRPLRRDGDVRRRPLRHAAHRPDEHHRRADHRRLQGRRASTLLLDQGLGGQLGRPPVGLVPAGWNDFAGSERRRDVRQPVPRRRRRTARSCGSGCTT